MAALSRFILRRMLLLRNGEIVARTGSVMRTEADNGPLTRYITFATMQRRVGERRLAWIASGDAGTAGFLRPMPAAPTTFHVTR
jgi:hypothetical protein